MNPTFYCPFRIVATNPMVAAPSVSYAGTEAAAIAKAEWLVNVARQQTRAIVDVRDEETGYYVQVAEVVR